MGELGMIWAAAMGYAAALGILPRPQDPSDRPYAIEKVSFEGGDPAVRLAGELTLPHGEGPFPAVALLTGSGPQDRNETLAGHRPFLVISDHLTRNGLAVLRWDDRGVGKSTGDFGSATPEDFARDAAAAFDFLAEDERIDRTAIGFLGHSEGGIVAPLAARQSDPAFLVLLAAPAIPLLPDLYTTQLEDVLVAEGHADQLSTIAPGVAGLHRILAEAASAEVAKRQITDHFTGIGHPSATVKAMANLWGTDWGRFYADFDPAPHLSAYGGPVLALFGATDLQVAAHENAGPMQAALRHARSKVTVFAGLNHLFQPSETGKISDYLKIRTTIAPQVLEEISTWIIKEHRPR